MHHPILANSNQQLLSITFPLVTRSLPTGQSMGSPITGERRVEYGDFPLSLITTDEANNALWIIAMVRLSRDPQTRAYSDRRKTEGLSHREIVRCLKRYLARHLYPILLKDLAALT
ncbi:MAG: hypothetical protein ACI9N0_001125 [Ilumatobacter sp.]